MTPTELRVAVRGLQAQGHSVREISRLLALSRNTVRRILRAPAGNVAEAPPCDEATLGRLKAAFARVRGVLQVGAFLGLGGRLIAIPYDSLNISEDGRKIHTGRCVQRGTWQAAGIPGQEIVPARQRTASSNPV
jgi:hypothetical protein